MRLARDVKPLLVNVSDPLVDQPPLSTATRSGLPISGRPGAFLPMDTKSQETIYGASVRAAASAGFLQVKGLRVEGTDRSSLASC